MNTKMIKMAFAGLVLSVSGLANAGIIFLDMDSVLTGSNLDTASLVTSAGTISFSGEITTTTDPDFSLAGASGNNLDIVSGIATLSFDFDVSTFEFIFGGNSGVFNIVARDMLNNTVDSFFQASTSNGELAGPVTLSGTGIRSIVWTDPGNNYAAIDNITITTNPVPTPATLALLALGLAGLGWSRRKKA
jgi:hypothetical protein